MLLVALLLICIDLIFINAVKRSFKIFDFIRKKFVFNFVVKLLVENSLYLMVFSMINLQYPDLSTPSKVISFIFAFGYVAINSTIAIASILIVYQRKNILSENLQKTLANYPRADILFFQLKMKQSALIFYSLYIIRTMCISIIYIAFRNYQVFQLFGQIFITLLHIGYLTKVQPFSIKALNVLEIMNEITILACQYYMIVFSDYVQMSTLINTIEFKYTQGKYLTYLIMATMIFKLLSVIISQLAIVWLAFLKAKGVILAKMRQISTKIREFLKKYFRKQKVQKGVIQQSNTVQQVKSEGSVFEESFDHGNTSQISDLTNIQAASQLVQQVPFNQSQMSFNPAITQGALLNNGPSNNMHMSHNSMHSVFRESFDAKSFQNDNESVFIESEHGGNDLSLQQLELQIV